MDYKLEHNWISYKYYEQNWVASFDNIKQIPAFDIDRILQVNTISFFINFDRYRMPEFGPRSYSISKKLTKQLLEI